MTFSAIQFLILAALLAVAAADSAYPAYPAHSKGYEYVILNSLIYFNTIMLIVLSTVEMSSLPARTTLPTKSLTTLRTTTSATLRAAMARSPPALTTSSCPMAALRPSPTKSMATPASSLMSSTTVTPSHTNTSRLTRLPTLLQLTKLHTPPRPTHKLYPR